MDTNTCRPLARDVTLMSDTEASVGCRAMAVEVKGSVWEATFKVYHPAGQRTDSPVEDFTPVVLITTTRLAVRSTCRNTFRRSVETWTAFTGKVARFAIVPW